ncbi:putative condensin complex component cnd2 [Erysiphe necator]|uniref:Condensin complex subunit 2 n=1 Tax=Uncinula necator TaxID=52586 RepID=A0A0B1P783_UNCNE|nr:putative condensin complex component cnd2 [Erysiphe necator]
MMSMAGKNRKRGTSIVLTGSPSKSPIKIPLNDDAQEKAKRLQSRQALHGIQLNQIKAAASPVRRLANFDRADSSSPPSNPKTPRRIGKENEFDTGLLKLGGNAVTPMKRVPLLANFEEWMKMATDNKINATNSWNFALIDYFHDLSLLKEGDSVNFQKASCTLDGCVKIYTSRVDSVATETGKLLSGLADSSNSKVKKSGNDSGEESEEEVEEEDGVIRKRIKKRSQRSCDTTLASSFETLRLKKFELEFSVDPLFKKASADFDEGGAKGLLLNHLSIDCQGRIVFDSSDDAIDNFNENLTSGQEDANIEGINRTGPIETVVTTEPNEHGNADVDIASLQARFFPNLDALDDQDICPSLKNFDLGDTSNNVTKIPFLKAPEEWRSERDRSSSNKEICNDPVFSTIDDHQTSINDEDNDDDGLMGNFLDTGFGEGGEVWARDACVVVSNRVHDMGLDYDSMVGGDCKDTDGRCSFDFIAPLDPSTKLKIEHSNILSYFDEGLQKNWAGPEHWRIRKIKDANKLAPIAKPKKEKELFEINFSSPLNTKLSELIFTQSSSSNVICLPKREYKNKNKNLLPDDKHFSSKQLLGLFLKPTKRLESYQIAYNSMNSPQIQSGDNINEAFWAQPNENNNTIGVETHGNYDANFFQDNEMPIVEDLDDDNPEYMDTQENPSTILDGTKGVDASGNVNEGVIHDDGRAFGNHLITQNRRQRPDYVQFARVAKKVDVRKLKEELWKGINYNEKYTVKNFQTPGRLPTPDEEVGIEAGASLKFTSIMKNLQKVYPKQDMSEISTSYCFICLLHLANEKGLIIHKNKELTELEIIKDKTIAVSVSS